MTRPPRRWGRAATLFRLGHRAGLGAGAGSSVHRIGLALAAAAVALTGALCVAADAVYTARAERMAARSPVLADADRADEAFAQWRERGDTVGERRFSVIFLTPTRPDAPLPPGLPRWPEPGEAFLSPALLAADPAMQTRYGTVAGTVEADGLSESGELLAYVAPQSMSGFEHRLLTRARTYVVDWGVDPAQYTDPSRLGFASFINNTAHDRPARDLYALLAVVVGLPVAALVMVSVRFGAERRDRRLAMLHALGAPRRARAVILAGEAFVPVVLGASVATAVALVPTAAGIRLPVTGYEVAAADLAAARPGIAGVWLGTVGLMLAVAVVGQLRVRRAAGTRPRAVRDRAHRWAPYVFALFMAVALGGAIQGGGAGVATYLLGLTGTLATLPLVAGRIAAALGRLIARRGRRAGKPAGLVAGRWLVGRPNALARLSAALVIGLCLATVAQISFTQLDTALAQDREVSARIGHAVVQVRGYWDDQELRRFTERIGADRVLRVANTDRRGKFLFGTCRALAVLGELSDCPRGAVPMERAYTGLTDAGSVVRDHSVFADWRGRMSVSAGNPPYASQVVGLVVFNPDGSDGVDAIKQVAYATLSMSEVTVPAELALTGTAAWAGLADWLMEFAIVGLVVLFSTGVLAAAAVFLALARELGPLASQGAPRRMFYGVAWWNLVVPLVAALLVSAGAAAALGRMLIELSNNGTLDPAFLTGATATGMVAAVAVGLVCGWGAAARARSWRPSAE